MEIWLEACLSIWKQVLKMAEKVKQQAPDNSKLMLSNLCGPIEINTYCKNATSQRYKK
jgi:hypothetical protein